MGKLCISFINLPETVMSDRISDLQKRLDRLYKLLEGQELAKDEAETAEKARIQLKIDGQWKEIRTVEREYTIALSQQMKKQDLPEPIALTIVGELVDELELIQPKTDEMRSMLQEILVKLNEPGVAAAAKLKVAIPLVPGFVAIELEGDTGRQAVLLVRQQGLLLELRLHQFRIGHQVAEQIGGLVLRAGSIPEAPNILHEGEMRFDFVSRVLPCSEELICSRPAIERNSPSIVGLGTI